MARTSGSRSEITGPRLRAAAEQLFARHGFAAVSMRQIAAEVGVQVGALYLYTPDKQSLLFRLMREHMEELLAAWDAAPKSPDPVEQLSDFVAFHLRFNLDRRAAVFVSYMELRSLEPENFAVIEGLRRRYEALVEEILIAGCGEGTFRAEDTRVTALALIAMLTGPNTWFREGGRLDLAELTRIYIDMTFRLVLVSPPLPGVTGRAFAG